MSYCEVRYEHFKREDSTNSIIVTLFDDDQVTPIVPNSSHSWSAKVAKEEDEEKYMGEYPVQIHGNEIILTSDRLVRLPRGTYLMELWENNNGKVTIYPSADFIQFTIHKNATDTMGHVDPTTDINKIIDDLHKAGQNIKLGTVTTGAPGSSVIIRQRLENGQNLLDFTIPRGDKGDKGEKGDQGERGPQGIQGIQGPQGKTGQTGPVGPAPTLRVGSVTKVAPGGNPTASVTGSNGSYAINLGIPEGQQGAKGDGFTDYGNITKSGDLNDYMRTGVADIQASMANKPAGYEGNWGVLKVYAPDNGSHHIVQEWYPSGTSNGTMFFRYYTVSNGGGKWDAWQKIGGVNDGWLDYIVGALGTNHNLVTTTNKIKWNPTMGQVSEPADGTTRFTFTDSTVRGLWASRNGVELVKTGKKYIFRCKIRASEPMDSLVAGNADAIWDKTTITTDWQDLETIFDSTKGFNIYAKGNSGGWFEIKDQVLIEAGGVATPNLMTFSDQTLTISQSFPMWSGIPVTDVLSPGHYFASYRYDTSGNRDDTTRIRIATRDVKYDASAKWGGYPVVGNPAYLEFDVPNDGRSYMAWLYTTDYQVSATVPMHYTDGYIGKISDQVGGVANTIDIGNPTIPAAVSVDDTIQLAKYTAANNNEQDLLDYNLGQKLEPSTKYRISFVARGNVGLNIYLYPGAAPSPDGTRQDGRVTQNLSNDFHTYSYELTTFGSFSGDPNKQLLFRFPSNSNGGFVEIYPSSVSVKKVGG